MAAAAEKVALNSDLTPKPISFASMWIAQYLAFGLSPHSVMGLDQAGKSIRDATHSPVFLRTTVTVCQRAIRVLARAGVMATHQSRQLTAGSLSFSTQCRAVSVKPKECKRQEQILSTHRPRASYKLIRANVLVANHRQPRVAVGKRPSRDVPAERRAVRAGGMRLRVLPVRWSHVIG